MARSPRPLDGRVVAITGSGRGIGRATAQACARAGM
jgi:NAD(P)-dependent dehydrogenase (short-subunit alcohol dehydrogenase family)